MGIPVYNVGDFITDDLLIIDKTRIKKGSQTAVAYIVKCIDCGCEYTVRSDMVKRKTSCKNCKKRKSKDGKYVIYKYNVGDIVNMLKIENYIMMTSVTSKNRGKSEYKVKGYKTRCIIDGYELDIKEDDLKSGKGCPVCAGKRVVKGINDISTTHPQYVKYFKKIEDVYTNTHGSHKRVELKCPMCDTRKTMSISNLCRHGFSCSVCSDGFSYPEKFVSRMIHLLNIDYVTQLSRTTYEWCGRYRYDFYIKDYNIIIESNGLQHYKEMNRNGARTLEEEQTNDETKKKLALGNGVKHYIELDCRYSEMNWIKSSIMNSELPKLLNFKEEDIDWRECEKFALSSRIKEVCDLWDTGEFTDVEELSRYININSTTVRKYLKIGHNIKICIYDTKEYNKRNNYVKVICDDIEFKSISDCARYYGVNIQTMSSWLNGRKTMAQRFRNMGLRRIDTQNKYV